MDYKINQLIILSMFLGLIISGGGAVVAVLLVRLLPLRSFSDRVSFEVDSNRSSGIAPVASILLQCIRVEDYKGTITR